MDSREGEVYTIFTVCNLAYLPKALVLAESLLAHECKKLNIYLIDKKCEIALPTSLATFVWIEDVGISNLYGLAFKYDITEFSTSIKPFVALQLLEKFPKVIFLDPDTCVYYSIEPILSDLSKYPIVLTPHYTKPQPDTWSNSDIGMMRFGSFNLGFFAVSRSDEGENFLKWWSDRCFRFCFFETQFGLSTDQKWVSIAPCFFENLHVSFNLGYNVAFWNIHERDISHTIDGTYLVNEKYPLIFFHFSSFNEERPELLSRRSFVDRVEDREVLRRLSESYSARLKKYSKDLPKKKYAFDYMSNGDYISPTLRRAYACVAEEFTSCHNPFDSNGSVANFARKNFLFEGKSTVYVPAGYNDAAKHGNLFYLVNFAMRIILKILGPNRFSNFSRLLVYLSSYRQNRGLWKV